MKYETRRAARQYLLLLAILLCSLLLVTCLGSDEGDDPKRDYSNNRYSFPAQTTNTEGRGE